MTSATVNSATTTFAYRGDGLRNSRTTGATTTTFTWDIAGGLPVVLDDGARYVYGAGLVSQVSGANSYYYLADGLGSTMKTVDATGAVVNGYTYDIYGKKTSSTGSQPNEFDFAGQQTDPTGLQYLRARYYDPETGTFVSREPMAVSPSWTGNPTSYAGANPARYTDPTGLFPVDESGCALTDAGCQARTKAEADENSVCNGLYYYQWQFCRDELGDETFGHWKAKVIVFGLFGRPLVGEYLHNHLKSCAEDSECRTVLEFVVGGPAAAGAGGVSEAWKKDFRYAWLVTKGSWLLVGGQQIVSSYLTLYQPED